MTTRIGTGSVGSNVEMSPTATRVTPQPMHPFNAVLRAGAANVMAGAQSAASALPGGPVLAAAIRGVPAPSGTATDGLAPGSAGATSPTLSAAAGGSQAASLESSMARQAEDNLYYLGLQQRIQDENRHFTTVSNVLKTRHDTAKNSIGNLR